MQLPKPNQTDFENAPAGTFIARCYRFIDMGTQHTKDFNGADKFVHQVRLAWELPTELMTKGSNAQKPFSMTHTYTWSMHEKANLRIALERWRGKKFTDADFGEGGFNTKKLIGVPCTLGIIHYQKKDGTTGSKISSITPIMNFPGFVMPAQVNESLYFSFDEAMAKPETERMAYLNDFFGKVAQGTREAIMRTPEYQKAIGNTNAEDHHAEDSSYGHANEPIPDDSFSDSVPF